MNRAVKDGIRQSGVWKSGMPIGNRDLRDDDRGRFAKTIIEDLKQVLS